MSQIQPSQISTTPQIKSPTLHLYRYVLRNSINDRPEMLQQRRELFDENLQKLTTELLSSMGKTASDWVKLVPIEQEIATTGTVLDLTNVPSEFLKPNDHRLYLESGIFRSRLTALRLNDTYLLRLTRYVPSSKSNQDIDIFENLRANIINLPIKKQQTVILGQTAILAGIFPPSQSSLKDIAAKCLSSYYGKKIDPNNVKEDLFLDSPFYIHSENVQIPFNNYFIEINQLTCVFLYKDQPTEQKADKVYRILQELLLSYHKIEFFQGQSLVLKKLLDEKYKEIEHLTEDYQKQQWKRKSMTKLPQESLEYYKMLSFLKDQVRTIQVNFDNYHKLLEEIKKIGDTPIFLDNFEKNIKSYIAQIESNIGFLSPGIQLYEKLMLSLQTQISINEAAIQDRQVKLGQLLTGSCATIAIGQILYEPIKTTVSRSVDKGGNQISVQTLWYGAGLTIILSICCGYFLSKLVYQWFTKEKF